MKKQQRRNRVLKGAQKEQGAVVTPEGEVKPVGQTTQVVAGGVPQNLGETQTVQPEAGKPPGQEPPKEGQTQPETPPPAAEEPKPDPRMAKYTDLLQKNGKLTDQEIKDAAKDFGLPENVVKDYVDRQVEALNTGYVEQIIDAAHSAVGGEANWKAFADWANANMDAGEVATMMEALQGKSPTIAKAIVAQAYEAFKKAGGGTGPTDASRGGSPPANPGVQGFASKDEQNAAIRDRRYRTDPAYRAQVEARMVASRFT